MIDEQTDKPRHSFWKELPILLGVAILVAVLVRAFVLQTFFIPSPSMENTLKIDDRVLVNKLVYNFRTPHRGEVIVFKAPVEWSGNPAGEDFIKRVIGVGGDRVVCCDAQDRLVINGVPLDEPYIFSFDGQRDKPADQEFDVVVPEGRLWVMGDHRSASGDSLEHYQQSGENVTAATIPEKDVVGRAFTVFWPFNRATLLTVPEGFEAIPAP
ncbi:MULTISPECIES: signal peptidase I [Micromonospora]|uniref:Signal peptidase I n=1 Tax=Micromonospora maris TaxID=1003110 RepID=A0A9X0LFQ5_9ACTN|nr:MULTISPECIES: signal peptidase I [Micromonospora]AEB43436.1 signal peptidase I [Micromonospora maris AB-18-032]KUJ48754.1 S26 family signal peptidase [Micromonospora maris]RUL92938.1 signal peptidase I [Verrucosispora sp. FIM060022]